MTGHELQQWRQRRGLTQDSLADFLGVTQVAVSRAELGDMAVPFNWDDKLKTFSSDARRVVKTRWLELREPFEQVWSGKAQRVNIPDKNVKIYRVRQSQGKSIVRIDIADSDWGPGYERGLASGR